MAEEKIVVLNLKKDSLKTPKWRRSKDIVPILRRKIESITRSNEIRIDPKINEMFWSRGSKYPEMMLRIKIKKSDDGKVDTELVE